MRTRHSGAVLAAFLVGGCSSGGGAGMTPMVDEAGTAPGAGDGGMDGGMDASSPVVADAGHVAPLFPLARGRSWTYRGSFRYSPDGYTLSVEGTREVNGHDSFELLRISPPPYRITEERVRHLGQLREGAYWFSHYDTGASWVEVYRWPARNGATWKNESRSFKWTRVGGQTVPAGTFDDCWKQESFDNGNEAVGHAVLCNGVGPVLIEDGRKGVDSDFSHYELIAKSF